MCLNHEKRAKAYGSPTARLKRTHGGIAKALDEAAYAETNECIILTGYSHGHPSIPYEGRSMLAARAVWVIRHGDPGDRLVLHRCNRVSGAHGSINIRHLKLGDHAQNMREAAEAGAWGPALYNRGALHGQAKLTEKNVREIRRLSALGVGRTALAERFNVSRATIRAVAIRRTWAWLPDDEDEAAA
ncbi:hypothetical protein [Streptomyces sp. NPDC001275]